MTSLAPRRTGDDAPATVAAPAPAAGVGSDAVSAHTKHGHDTSISFWTALTTYTAYTVLMIFGKLRDFLGRLTGCSRYFNSASRTRAGYAPLSADWENFFTRRMYHRVQDCFNRPIAGPPTAANLKVVIRESNDGNYTLRTTENIKSCLNLSSYNYLGFADDWHTTCKADVEKVAREYPVSTCTSFAQGGYTALHSKLEETVARYVGKESSMIFNMGYATNFLGIPALISKGCLILSDSLNHASIVNGARSSGATIRVFKHNDPANLERLLRHAIIEGQERTRLRWRKILVMVEGIYSMEGEVCRLPEIVRIAKQYKAYVYLDEAHSIGAMGATGRGICEHTGVNPADVDILMGTFTKSFGAMGGYIAGSRTFVDAIRSMSAGFLSDNAMAPAVCSQILTAFKVMLGEDGTDTGASKLRRLHDNANYFRSRLIEMGAQVFGDHDSPVVPLMVYNPTKCAAFSRECLKRGLAVVIVGFPATSVLASRARFCVSAGHTREELDEALLVIQEVCTMLKLRYRKSMFG